MNVQILRSIGLVQVDTYKYAEPYGHRLQDVCNNQLGLEKKLLLRKCRTNVTTKLPVNLL